MTATTNESQLASDVDAVARAEIVAHVEYGVESGELSHESCPEIGSEDWQRVAARIKEIMGELGPDDDTRSAAYARLVDRAETE